MARRRASALNCRSNSNTMAEFHALIDCLRNLLRIDAGAARAVNPAALGIDGDLDGEL